MGYGIIPALLCICTCCMYTAVGTAVGPEVPAVERIQLGHRYIGSALYINTGHQARSRERREARERRDTPSGGTSPGKPTVDSLSVLSYINSRFATTTVTSEMTNTGPDNQEAKFVVQIPETAFISNFSMLVGEEWVTAAVKEKGQAQTDYEEAKQQNKTTGLVAADTEREPERDLEYFKVSVNVGPDSSVRFVLEYQELISRRLGLFRHRISVRPQQLVQQLRVDVKIYEPQGIPFVDVIEPSRGSDVISGHGDYIIGGDDVIADVTDVSDEVKSVTYSPSYEEQEKFNKTHGVDGDLIVDYDTFHTYEAGHVQTAGNYFVHFFSPSGPSMVPLGKNVVFVIDISRSMSGNKIEQTRESLQTILCQLRPGDQFLLILFDGLLYFWPENQQLRYATQENISKAKQFVYYEVKATNSSSNFGLRLSLVRACQILSENKGTNLVVFLTDGQPTAGVTSDQNGIISEVVEAAADKVSIFSLEFGWKSNSDFLATISAKTGGFARRIYDNIDISQQLVSFFKEIDTPLANNINISYNSNAVDTLSLTKVEFKSYFKGSEIVVAGKLKPNRLDISEGLKVESTFDTYNGNKVTTENRLEKTIDTSGGMTVPPEATKTYQPGFLERLYIYMKIKDLLNAKLLASDAAEKQELEDYALQLALDYNFVTPLTSLLVVEPPRETTTPRPTLTTPMPTTPRPTTPRPTTPRPTTPRTTTTSNSPSIRASPARPVLVGSRGVVVKPAIAHPAAAPPIGWPTIILTTTRPPLTSASTTTVTTTTTLSAAEFTCPAQTTTVRVTTPRRVTTTSEPPAQTFAASYTADLTDDGTDAFGANSEVTPKTFNNSGGKPVVNQSGRGSVTVMQYYILVLVILSAFIIFE